MMFGLIRKYHIRQSEIYNRKVHGEPYNTGDIVWFHNPAVTTRESRKLYHPWTGPYRVIDKISEADYRIKEVYGKKDHQLSISIV